MGNVENLIDAFIFTVNRRPKAPLEPGAPASVRVGAPDEDGRFAWAAKSYPDIDWIPRVEETLEFRLPRYYRALVGRWIFPSFGVRVGKARMLIWGNTPEGTDAREWRRELARDWTTYAMLAGRGFLPWGNPEDARATDPICFDLNRKRGDGDCPVVRVMLQPAGAQERVKIVADWAPSLRDFIEAVQRGSE